MLEIGSVVDGKYKILNKIGQGGMSVVYLAMNERANKQWAIKEVRKDGGSNFEVVKQNLIAETDILKRLNHPHLPSIIDVIDMEDTFLIVMDYIEGNPLSKKLKEEGAQPQDKVIEWAKQITDVLGYLHSRKPPIIYRDMKPSNVMLKPDGNIMIIDFGTAREWKTASVEDTTCLGTRGYAAPEQFGGYGQTDARTDIYCLGATLYHLVTGHNPCLPPYQMYPIREWNPNLSSGLEEIILKCTQPNPDERYQSCAELMYALEHYDELDQEYKKTTNRKWKTFLATSILTVAAAGAAVGFHIAETNTTSKSYDSYVKELEHALTFDTAAEAFENAAKLNPGNDDAYVKWITYSRSRDENWEDITTSGEPEDFSKKEASEMISVLGYKGDGTRSNQDYLSANANGYAKVAYEIGIAYYFFYNETGSPSMSQTWFEIAAEATPISQEDKTGLTQDQVTRAKILAKIAGYDSSLRGGGNSKTGDADVTYRDYWNDMVELVGGKDLIAEDNLDMAVVEYKYFVNQIYNYTVKFKAAGVTQEEMQAQLDNVISRLSAANTSSSTNENIASDIADVISRAQVAKGTVEVTFSEDESNLTNTPTEATEENTSGGSEDAGTAATD